MRWHGGEYGLCPYVNRGNKKYFIKDVYDEIDKKYKYVFAVADKSIFFKKFIKCKSNRFAYSQKLFSKWYKFKFKREVNQKFFNGTIYDWRYDDPKRTNVVFWGDERNGNVRIGCYDEGKWLSSTFTKMTECKKFGEKWLERYENVTEAGQIKMF